MLPVQSWESHKRGSPGAFPGCPQRCWWPVRPPPGRRQRAAPAAQRGRASFAAAMAAAEPQGLNIECDTRFGRCVARAKIPKPLRHDSALLTWGARLASSTGPREAYTPLKPSASPRRSTERQAMTCVGVSFACRGAPCPPLAGQTCGIEAMVGWCVLPSPTPGQGGLGHHLPAIGALADGRPPWAPPTSAVVASAGPNERRRLQKARPSIVGPVTVKATLCWSYRVGGHCVLYSCGPVGLAGGGAAPCALTAHWHFEKFTNSDFIQVPSDCAPAGCPCLSWEPPWAAAASAASSRRPPTARDAAESGSGTGSLGSFKVMLHHCSHEAYAMLRLARWRVEGVTTGPHTGPPRPLQKNA